MCTFTETRSSQVINAPQHLSRSGRAAARVPPFPRRCADVIAMGRGCGPLGHESPEPKMKRLVAELASLRQDITAGAGSGHGRPQPGRRRGLMAKRRSAGPLPTILRAALAGTETTLPLQVLSALGDGLYSAAVAALPGWVGTAPARAFFAKRVGRPCSCGAVFSCFPPCAEGERVRYRCACTRSSGRRRLRLCTVKIQLVAGRNTHGDHRRGHARFILAGVSCRFVSTLLVHLVIRQHAMEHTCCVMQVQNLQCWLMRRA